ncbi:DHH family phosphoesterase [Deinococcus maricopensis]|uniref:Phosphoesterase RecJ domain protein n=1 Tax=Deinococcus maricopensis (strain DSM 21211 / LMG 22137 / NRRL B-23946 / LB-34) TaxID=709986 RepID=E8UAZ5_DEIML|nr:DHH family phosphoesterase [Deinococcus maricopensis]ADV68234.1 phosphoesterase RecJ domain protein [Deinococcus maricopensis DSM 21211]
MTQNAAEPRYGALISEAARLMFGHAGPVVVLTHVDPDGDAVGSVLGLARALRAAGRDVVAVADAPRYLRFLVGEGELVPRLDTWPDGALAVVLDVDNTDAARVAGADVTAFAGPVVNVDHHGTNARRATVSVVDPSQSATALMVKDLLDAVGAPLSADVAEPLLLGLNTDTGSFRFGSTTPGAFRAAADLLAAGARLGWMNEMLGQQPRVMLALQREVLGTVAFPANLGGLVVTARVDDAMLARAGAAWEDVESMVGLIRSAEGTELAALFKDYGDRVKLSLRSRGRVSAQRIAVACGGGGHVAAAGATVNAPFAEAYARFEQEARGALSAAGFDPDAPLA